MTEHRSSLARRGRLEVLSRDFVAFLVASSSVELATQMVVVALGWQVYAIHRSPFDLGLIGLVQFLPTLLLSLPAGHLADRFPRRLVFAGSTLLSASVTLGLLLFTLDGGDLLWPFLLLAAAAGFATGVGAPAARALGPALIPLEAMARGMAFESTAISVGIVVGPALGGVLFAASSALVYGAAAALLVLSVIATCMLGEPAALEAAAPEAAGRLDVFSGVRFIRNTPVMLGAITLDLFAVLFGGAVALLPAFARSILHVGPVGLGLLRSAPAAGALLAGIVLMLRPLRSRTGRTLIVVVGTFGLSMVVFGLSHSYALSLLALAVSGFVDMVSMNIRGTIAALAAPDGLRGRALAVELVFLSASNELGAFESGMAAALIGLAPSVIVGGAVTVGLALLSPRLFPALARIDRLEELNPELAATLSER